MSPADAEQTRYRMGTLCEVRVWGEPLEAARALEAAFEVLGRVEAKFSLFDPESETSRVNQTAGREPVKVSAEFSRLLALSLRLSKTTQGAFDITARHGFRTTGWRAVSLSPWSQTVRFTQPGIQLDFGGIGKGHALDQATEALSAFKIERAIVDAGGNFKTLGFTAESRFGIEHPLEPDRIWAQADLVHPAVSSSSNQLRTREIEGKRVGHVVDPRTGQPATGGGATVLAASAALADALSTALLILGAEGSASLAHWNAQGIFFEEAQAPWISDGFEPHFYLSHNKEVFPCFGN